MSGGTIYVWSVKMSENSSCSSSTVVKHIKLNALKYIIKAVYEPVSTKFNFSKELNAT